MHCALCDEKAVGPDHDISEKHIRNKTLYDYMKIRKQFAGNRKGALVSCAVKSSFANINEYTEGRIQISAKPNEEVKFNFTIKNDTKKEDILVISIQLAHNRLKFVANDHGMGFGCNPVKIEPKTTLKKEVSYTFQSSNIGQYEMTVVFSLRKPENNESILIMRDMVVFVEETKAKHEKINSPYNQQDVSAKNLFKKTSTRNGNCTYPIPPNHKAIYAGGLKPRKDATEDENILCESIKEIFTTGVCQENYIRFFHNLLWYEETIVRINLKNYNMSGVPLQSAGQAYYLVVPGLAEKRPSLMLGDLLFVKPHKNEDVMFEAEIDNIEDNVAKIKGLHPEFSKYYKFEALFDIRFFMSRMPLERMHKAVNKVTEGSTFQQRVFPKANKTIPMIKPIQNFYNMSVQDNAEQRSAVQHILAGTSGTAPYLVHGPPGTGKTVTIVEAILQLVNKDPRNRILVCTDSNMAADHVATMLIKYMHMMDANTKILRANSKFRVWETLPEGLRKFSNGWKRDNFEPVSIADFSSYNMVITTLSHAAKFAKQLEEKRMKPTVSHLFIDEAAQASEPSCLIPVVGLLSTRGSLVLAGDPLQLGPVVISHSARRLGLGLSLMERLKNTVDLYKDDPNDPNYMVMLRNNFRSNPDILHIPNDIFYKGQLRAQADTDPISIIDILGEKRLSRAIVFHGVLSKEQRMGKSPSFFNSMEFEIVKTYISALVKKHNVEPADIGVVAPYIRQAYLIKNWLEANGYKIEVGTVEAFQGKEKRIILISTVRANCNLLAYDAKFQLGFLVDDKRFNVALTRAKAKAIIIGNPICLQKDVKWRAYMDRCRELGTYCGYDPGQYLGENNDDVQKLTPIIKQMQIGENKDQ